MKVLALNSSPRGGGHSKTELMLNHLVDGMRDAGADVEVVALRKKKVNDCLGCFTCWTKTPGQCVHKDDMTLELFPKLLQADLVVHATPLYFHSMNGIMRRFLERILPAVQPFFEQSESRTYHPLRHRLPRSVWLSVCGFPEESEFNMLSALLHYIYDREGMELVAEIYRPTAESLVSRVANDIAEDILAATRVAGQELVRSGQISAETMARMKQPMRDRPTFMTLGNLAWKTCIAEGVTMPQFQERKMVPRPDSIETFMLIMPYGLNTQAAAERQIVVQFNFSGETGGSCYFTVQKDGVQAATGTSAGPDLTIESPFDVWMDILTGKAEGPQMLMEGKYRVDGDLPLMIKLFERQEEPVAA
jgi:multimeric flavodoxin WrbA